jgi:CheY-like chemotaxis protein
VRLGGHNELDRKAAVSERAAGEVTGSRLNARAPVRILVVDDDPVLRDVFADLIHGLGYQVTVVADAGEALGQVRSELFDVLVTDILLPGMDGWQLIAAAVLEQPMLQPVAMTGGDERGDRARAYAKGVPVLQKPFTLAELRAALQEALTSSRRP